MSDRPAEPQERHASDERAAIGELTDEVLPALIARLRASRLGELEISSGGWRVRLRRASPASARDDRGPRTQAAMTGDLTGAIDEGTELAAGVARSPGVGYFAPDRDVAIGLTVQAGDPLGTVDVLGVFQEVTAPLDGVISRVLAEPGQAVEYGQPLAEIDALGLAPESLDDADVIAVVD